MTMQGERGSLVVASVGVIWIAVAAISVLAPATACLALYVAVTRTGVAPQQGATA